MEIVDLEEGDKNDGNFQNDLGEGAKNDDSQDEIETRLEIIDDEESAEDDSNKETGTRSMMIDLGEGAELNDNNQNVPGTRSELIKSILSIAQKTMATIKMKQEQYQKPLKLKKDQLKCKWRFLGLSRTL